MPSVLRITAFGCAIVVASAKWTKRSEETERWEIPRETDGVMNMDAAGWTPKPTQAPDAELVEMELMKRAGTSTCGYYSGYSASAAVVCINSAQCIVNDGEMALGCCRSTNVADCAIPTTCVPSQSAALYSAASNLDYTLLCTSAAYPNCVTYSYDQFDALYPGYSALGCGVDAGVYSVEYYAPALGSAVTTSRTSISSRILTASSSIAAAASTDSGGSTTRTTSSSSLTSTLALASSTQTSSPTETAVQSSGTSPGPIVGGVIGGVAGLALIALGIFFLVRHLGKNKEGGTSSPTAPTQSSVYYQPGTGPDPSAYGQGPPMAQPPQQLAAYPPAGFVGADGRTSMAPSTFFTEQTKPPQFDSHISTTPISPVGSPPPQSYTPPSFVGEQQAQYQAYNPAQQAYNPGQQAYNPNQQAYNPPQPVYNPPQPTYNPPQPTYNPQQPYNPSHARASELGTGLPDGELRELA